jgi:hypothetical protein
MIFSQKQKKQSLLKFFIHLGSLAHSIGHLNPRLRYHSTNEANQNGRKVKMCRELILLCRTGNLSESQVLWPTMVGTVGNKIKQE